MISKDWERQTVPGHTHSCSMMNAAAALYHEMYGVEQGAEQEVESETGNGGGGDKVIPVTFQLLCFIGWKLHKSQVSK